MSYEGLSNRLMFWADNNLVSKFSIDIVPHVGEIWHVPKGEHKYAHEQGVLTVEILRVVISPYTWHIDIDIDCRVIQEGRRK